MFRNPEQAKQDRPRDGSPDESGVRRRPRAPEAAKVQRREPRTAEQEEMAKAYAGELETPEMTRARVSKEGHVSALRIERRDIEQRIKEMGGIWGEESFFVLEDRLKEINKELGEVMPESKVMTAEAKQVTTPLEFNQGVVKALEKKRKNLEKERGVVLARLAQYGIKDIPAIEAELAEMSPELREKVSGQKPGFGYQFRKFGRRLLGLELPLDAKIYLEKYHELELQQNANTRDMTEAQNQAYATGEKRPTPRAREPRSMGGETYIGGMRGGSAPAGNASMEGFVETFKEAPAMQKGKKELAKQIEELKMEEGPVSIEAKNEELARIENEKKMKVRTVWAAAADIEDAIKNLEGVKDERDVSEDANLYRGKLEVFKERLRELEGEGAGKAYDEALKAAEVALTRYSVAINRRLTSYARSQEQARKIFDEQVQEQNRRSEMERAAGVPRPESVIVRRSGNAGNYGTGAEARTRVELSRREAAPSGELVNKDIVMYRTEEWRKKLLDVIKADENWRVFMHEVYEEVSARLKELTKNNHEYLNTLNTPDAALDYALALFRGHARYTDGRFIQSKSDREMARAEIKHWDTVFGWGEHYKTNEEERAEPLKQEKRSRSEKELEDIEINLDEVMEEEPEQVLSEADVEFIDDRKKIEEEETLSVKEAQARFDDVNKELESVGVTSLAEKMKDDVFLKADAALRHAKRVERSEVSKRSKQEYKTKKSRELPAIEISLEEETPALESIETAEKEAEQGIPSLQELIALAKSNDNEHAQPKDEDLIHMKAPDVEHPVIIEEPPAKPKPETSKRPSLMATLEERLSVSRTKQTKSKKKRSA
jgi:hypothetical protein